jgi:thiol-disulfide isomerase/thioredoxin
LVARRDALAWELYVAHADHPQVPKLLAQRWMHRMTQPNTAGAAMAEIERVLNDQRGTKLETEILYLRAEAVIRRDARKPAATLMKNATQAIDAFTQHAPHDERGARLLLTLHAGTGKSLPTGNAAELANRILTAYPESPQAALLRQQQASDDRLGKPFALSFRDVATGAEVSADKLRGKVVVVHFWATWCQPSVDGLTRLTQLYETYHDKGVAFIGVSLDLPEEQGGRERLKEFLATHKLPWPQCYDGEAAADSIARHWGVVTIPAALVIDRAGNLAAVDAHERLESALSRMSNAIAAEGQVTSDRDHK